jgi:hypothetical protein
MRLAAVAPFCCAAALVAACDGDNSVRISSTTSEAEAKGVLKVIETLQCPETIGVLTRRGSAHAGGEVCVYSGPRGAEVSLHLIKLETETADAVLARFERDLADAMPHTAAALAASQEASEARAAADAARAQADAARAEGDAIRDEGDRVRAGASASSGDRASVRMPGLSVEANGDRADVRLPGLTIDAEGDTANVRFGNFSIHADDASQSVDVSSDDESVSVQARDDSAEIRTRAPGDTVRTTYILTDNRPAEAGWRLVGFEARGPEGGPIVVATVRAKDRDSDGVFDSAKDLVTLNVGE